MDSLVVHALSFHIPMHPFCWMQSCHIGRNVFCSVLLLLCLVYQVLLLLLMLLMFVVVEGWTVSYHALKLNL